jgi:hypothetical protein
MKSVIYSHKSTIKVKDKTFLAHAMRAYWRNRDIASYILNLGTR